MDLLKSFLYLDEYKMYSVLSQIFKGLPESIPESIIERSHKGGEKCKEEKDLLAGGILLGEIIRQRPGIDEGTFLHDYSYTLFEKYLTDERRVFVVNNTITDEAIAGLRNAGFVRITGNVQFNDFSKIAGLLKDHKKMAEAIGYLGTIEARRQAEQAIQDRLSQEKDLRKRTILKEQLGEIMNEWPDLGLDKRFVETLLHLMEAEQQDGFEVRMPIPKQGAPGTIDFSALMNRKLLREREDVLVSKYSRYTQKSLTVFGVVTQHPGSGFLPPTVVREDQSLNIKNIMVNVIGALAQMENTFIGKLDNEVIVDPIAIYMEF